MDQRLDKGQVQNWHLRETTIAVARGGRFWLTREGDSQDYLLVGGEALTLPRGRWVVQALRPGTLSRTEAVAGPQKIVFGRCDVEACGLPSVSGI